MSDTTRSWRFQERINVERRVLSCINDTFVDTAPLSGLTDAAITNWRSDVLQKYGKQAEPIAAMVREISLRSHLDADSSHDVFHGEELVPSASTENLLSQLIVTIEGWRLSHTVVNA
jgi:hypothetical protein